MGIPLASGSEGDFAGRFEKFKKKWWEEDAFSFIENGDDIPLEIAVAMRVPLTDEQKVTLKVLNKKDEKK